MHSSRKNMMMYRNDLLRAIDEAGEISACVDNTITTKNDDGSILSSTLPTTRSPDGLYFPSKPLRPLSAYNIFFLLQRERILQCGGSDEMMMEDIPFTVQDMKRVVRERNQLWAGEIVVPASPTATSSRSKKSKKNSPKIPSFGELARRIGLAWKKLDDDTKKRFYAFANFGKCEFYKTKNSDSVNTESGNILSTECSSSLKHSSVSLSEDLSSCQSYCHSLDTVASPMADRIISSTKVRSSRTGGIRYGATAHEVWDNQSSMEPTKVSYVIGADAPVASQIPKSVSDHRLSGLQPNCSDDNIMRQSQLHKYRNIQMMMNLRYQQNRMSMLQQRAKMAQQYQSRVWQQQYRAMMMMMPRRRQPDPLAMKRNEFMTKSNDDLRSQQHHNSVITARHDDESYNHKNAFYETEQGEGNPYLPTVSTVVQNEDVADYSIFNMLQSPTDENLNMIIRQRQQQHRSSFDAATPDEYDPSFRLLEDDEWLVADKDQSMIDFIDDQSLFPYPSEEDYDDNRSHDLIWS